MTLLFDAFRAYGGVWLVILSVLSGIAFSRLPQIQDQAQRGVQALSAGWLMKAAVGIALLSWAWNFGRLFFGDAYLRGAGKLAELSTILLGLVLVLAGVAWRAISWRRFQRFQPWLTQGLAVLLIVSGKLLADAPAGVLSQSTRDDKQRPAIAFVQGRLASLGCLDAQRPKDGSFNAFTALAVISFQAANDLAKNPGDTNPGEIASPEIGLLARPFPFLFGPRRCPPPESSSER
jgi:putative peptidoglycan binding protein